MASERSKHLLKNSAASVVLRVINIFMKFILRTVFLYYLGVEYTGISTLFIDILQVLSLFDLGISNAMIFALYKPMAERDSKKVSALMNFYKKAYFMIGVAVLVAGFAITPFLDYIVNDVPNITESIQVIFLFYVVTTASSYFLVYRQSLLIADQRARVVFNIDTAVVIIEGIVTVVLIMLLRNFMIYLVVHLAFTIIRNIVVSYMATKRYKDLLIYNDEQLTKRDTKVMFNNVFSLGIYKISGVIINSVDSIVISAYIGTKEIAILGSYKLIVNSIRQMIESIAEAAKPTIGNLSIDSTPKKQNAIFKNFDFIAFVIAIITTTCLFVLLDPFIENIWLSKEYKLSIYTVIALIANYYISIMVYPVEIFRTGNGLFIQGKYRPAFMALLNVILDLIFVRYYGITGVLGATVLSRVLTQVWFDALLVHRLVFRSSVLSYYKTYAFRFLLAIISSGGAYYMANAINLSNAYLDFIVKAIIALLVPIIIILVVYRKDEQLIVFKDGLKNMIHKYTKGQNHDKQN